MNAENGEHGHFRPPLIYDCTYNVHNIYTYIKYLNVEQLSIIFSKNLFVFYILLY